MILHLVGEVDEHMIDKLINLIHESDVTDGAKDVIYLCSGGGYYDQMLVLLDIINTYKESIILVGYGILGSAAFELFFEAQCEKQLLPGTRGMMHQATISIDTNEKGKAASADNEAAKKYITTFLRAKTIEFCKRIQMNRKEIQAVAKNTDVWLQYPRMLELLENVSKSE